MPVPPLALPKLRAALAAPGTGRGPLSVGTSAAPLTIVALGSSSTSGAGASTPDAAYPARLEAILRAARPDLAIRVVNRGRGGEQAEQMVARLESDVLSERPALVIWQVGANSALRRADPDRFRAVVAAGIARLREAGVEVVLMDNQRAPRIAAAPDHARFDAALAGLAGAIPGVALFSRGRLMDAWAAAGTPAGAMLIADGLHHNDRGYACLAAALAEALLGSGETPAPSSLPAALPGDGRLAAAPR
ncbi:SGNH/GDSL hydrolase family protein [Caldovatus aquaticus]|uniref:SGNH/GDSL hydrolase family protein n=1 Tax=Caldovatus aquaticus TaxID=2865671 RepID=UPI0034E251EF